MSNLKIASLQIQLCALPGPFHFLPFPVSFADAASQAIVLQSECICGLSSPTSSCPGLPFPPAPRDQSAMAAAARSVR